MKRILIALLITFTTVSFAQQENKKNNFWENVRFGGGFGLNFGSDNTTLSITPTALYDFDNNFRLGATLGYTYNKTGDFRSNVYTGSILSTYTPLESIELSAEFEQLFVNQKFNGFKTNYNYPALYVGIAYRIRNVSIGGRFDLLYNENKSIYTTPFTPIVRVFF